MNIKHYNQRGVSLTETLVTIAILGIITAALVSGLFVSIKGDQVAKTHISAEGLARYELEYVKHSNYWGALPMDYTLPGSPPQWDPTHDSLSIDDPRYSVTVSFTVLSDASSTTVLQKVTATVSYNDGGNIRDVISIDTYRTQ